MIFILFEASRIDDVRIYQKYSPTVARYWGTGGARVPYVFPIQDGREIEKNQNGLGIGNDGEPSYTLDRTGGQSVAYPIQGTVIGRSDNAGPQGKGFGDEGDPMFTLDRVSGHAVAYDEFNDSINDIHHTLRAGTKQSTGVLTSTVRRLTPIECERLQGFPDGWTDEQADSHRYKQMGNAVAVPVVQWIINRIVN